MRNIIEVTLARLTLPCALQYPEAAVFPAPDPTAPRAEIDPVCLSPEDWAYYTARGFAASPQAEYSLLTAAFSDALMDFDRLIIHGVALCWRDRAWLICAPSGVGKSTQARWLQTLRPGEFAVISGDRPILEFLPALPNCHSERSEESVPPRHSERSEESVPPSHSAAAAIGSQPPAPILVHPSPWNGKEDWYGAEAAPLAGIILLQRGEENRLEALKPRKAAVSVYTQLIQTAAREKKIRQAAELTNRLLRTVPVWRLTSRQPPASTQLLLDQVFIT